MKRTRKNRPDLWKKEKKIVELYLNKGLVPSEIGKIFNCNKTTIRTILKSNKIKLDRKRDRNVWKNKDKIINEYNKGLSASKIAQKFSCSYDTIYRILKQNNIEVKRNKRFWDKQDEIIKKYNEGMSADEIFKVMRCKSRTIIAKILEKNNIKIKPTKYYLKGKIPHNKIDLNPQKIRKIVTLYGKLSAVQLAKKFNYNSLIIYRILKENSIKIKENGFFQKGKRNSPKTEFKKGENHIYFNNWSSKEPYGIEFDNKLKKFIRDRDSCCMLCKIGFEDLKLLKRRIHIHHINYDKKCNLPQNLITLCQNCHGKTNSDRKIWTEHFQKSLSKRYGSQYSENQKIILNLNQKER